MCEKKPPCVMFSYAWENEDHKLWVKELAKRRQSEGIKVTLDQWDSAPGDQLTHFMETSIRENNYILVICTPLYRKKSNQRLGGVGYEGDIMTGEVVNFQNQRKFIPILRSGNWKTSIPTWMRGKYGIDLSGYPYSEVHYRDLLATLHGVREQAPPVGRIPQHLQNTGEGV